MFKHEAQLKGHGRANFRFQVSKHAMALFDVLLFM